MDVFTVLIWTAGILAFVVIAVALTVRMSRKRPVDPEENLRLLLGPRGMAERDRNRAAAEEKREAELLEYRNRSE
jgi:hypothetical protein